MSGPFLTLISLVILGVPVQYACSLAPEEAAALLEKMKRKREP